MRGEKKKSQAYSALVWHKAAETIPLVPVIDYRVQQGNAI